jgi:pilus assembly protein CpaB
MDGKKIALLVGALFVAAVTAIMAKSMFSSSTVAPPVVAAILPQPTGPQVLVATKPLPVGTILGPDAVRFQTWPKDFVSGTYYVKGQAGADPQKMIGMVVRNQVSAGQPVSQGALVSPKDSGFLAAALTPGMRAVTVPVSGASSVAGFVFPGDRIDLVLTSTVDVNSIALVGGQDSQQAQVKDNRSLQASETIVRNARVLATDQRYDNQPAPDGKPPVTNFTMVTLEVTPKMAEEVAVAQKIGSLSLSLRPLANNSEQLEAAVTPGDRNAPAGANPKASPVLLDVASFPQNGDASVTTGGQVSRFARNSLKTPQPQALGPVVHIARGNAVTDMPVGGK